MFKSITDALSKPRKKYSLETFKQLYQTLLKYPVIDDTNQVVVIETLRSIAELLIWGDQNEQRFFDFFFEKNIHTHFIKVLDQKTSSTVMVQLLQTLSILFENIQTDTSIYFLLSNNYVNTIITHKFDFSDEEIMAYYVSFLKTLSLKLNRNTIHFFFNEHLNDFPLYTEAIKFFNHSESMIRVAVRTLTLNVFKVPDERMLRFILDRTAVPYFSNLVWFISDQSTSLNEQIIKVGSSGKMGKLPDLVAEHVDNLYYLNDIFSLKVFAINEVLTAQVLKKLVIPLYVHSLIPAHSLSLLPGSEATASEPRLLPSVALYLLAQLMLIFTHKPIINVLSEILINESASAYFELMDEFQNELSEVRISRFAEPQPPPTVTKLVPLSERGFSYSGNKSLPPIPSSNSGSQVSLSPSQQHVHRGHTRNAPSHSSFSPPSPRASSPSSSVSSSARSLGPPVDADGRAGRVTSELFVFVPKPIIASPQIPDGSSPHEISALHKTVKNMFRQAVFDHLDASTNDQHALPAICLLQLILKNPSVDPDILKDANIFPRRYIKSRALLDALVSQDASTANDDDDNPQTPVPTPAAALPKEAPLPVPEAVDSHQSHAPETNGAGNNADSSTSSPADLTSSAPSSPPPSKPSSSANKHRRNPSVKLDPKVDTYYNTELVGNVLRTLLPSFGSCRSVSISAAIGVVLELVFAKGTSMCLTAPHVQLFRETEELMKANLLTSLNVFSDQFVLAFEDVAKNIKDTEVARLVMDPSVALPPITYAAPGVELNKRLPTNDVERIRKSIQDFLALRLFRNQLFTFAEAPFLPLAQPNVPIQPNDLLEVVHFNSSKCTVVDKDGFRLPRLLIVDDYRLILAENDGGRSGFGIVREVSALPAVLVEVDKRKNTCLDVTVTSNTGGGVLKSSGRQWSAKFEFEDSSLCAQAKLFIETGKNNLTAIKITRIREIILSVPPFK